MDLSSKVPSGPDVMPPSSSYLLQLFTHLICFCNQWHQFDVVQEHSRDAGVCLPLSAVPSACEGIRREVSQAPVQECFLAVKKLIRSLVYSVIRSIVHQYLHFNITSMWFKKELKWGKTLPGFC